MGTHRVHELAEVLWIDRTFGLSANRNALGLSRASLHRRQAFRRQPLAAVRPRPTPMRAAAYWRQRLEEGMAHNLGLVNGCSAFTRMACFR